MYAGNHGGMRSWPQHGTSWERQRDNSAKYSLIDRKKWGNKELKRWKKTLTGVWKLQKDQLCKLYIYQLCKTNSPYFWKELGKTGVGKGIPRHVVCEDGNVSDNYNDVMNKWKDCYNDLYNVRNDNVNQSTFTPTLSAASKCINTMNPSITVMEKLNLVKLLVMIICP